MRKIREVIRMSCCLGITDQDIANSLGIARSTVREYVKRAMKAGLGWPLPPDLDDRSLDALLYPVEPRSNGGRQEPDWPTVHRDMQEKGATITALHAEYLQENPLGLQRSQFSAKYKRWVKSLKSYLRQVHIPGENVFVDYCGPTFRIHDPQTGQVHHAQVFVGVLGASNYVYAEAHWTQSLANWVSAHARMFSFFGGATRFIVCDNLKAAVTRAHLTEPIVNETFQAFASHYGAVVVPARGYKPKDKAKAEGHVLLFQRWIMFRLRKHFFTNLAQLNAEISGLLQDLNSRKFQKYPGSRVSRFATTDQPALTPLPSSSYEYVEFRRARVGVDRMVQLNDRAYSVPASLVGSIVDLRITAAFVEILHGGRRVASHAITPGNEPVIDRGHLTTADHAYVYWRRDSEIAWAADIGPHTRAFMELGLGPDTGRTNGYRFGQSMRKLRATFGPARLESACNYALSQGGSRLDTLRAILARKLDIAPPAQKEAQFDHENVRGPGYYH